MFKLSQQNTNQRSHELPYNLIKSTGGSMDSKAMKARLARNVKNLMTTQNISAQEVQRRSGGDVTGRMVGYILKEERAASIDIVEALGKAFKVQPALLLTELSSRDIEHLDLISDLNADEKEEVRRYAAYLVDKRNDQSS